MIKRIRLKHFRGINPNYSFCGIVASGSGSGITHGFWFKKDRAISENEFDIMTKNGLRGKKSWSLAHRNINR